MFRQVPGLHFSLDLTGITYLSRGYNPNYVTKNYIRYRDGTTLKLYYVNEKGLTIMERVVAHSEVQAEQVAAAKEKAGEAFGYIEVPLRDHLKGEANV